MDRDLRTLIVEDEPLARELLRHMLESQPRVKIVGEASNGEEAVKLLAEISIDLVFLDIQLPRLTGIEVVQRVGLHKMPLTVFVTAFDSFALKAFEINAVDYLLKPFSEKRLRDSLDRARQRLNEKHEDDFIRQIKGLVEMYESRLPPAGLEQAESAEPMRISVRDGARTSYVPVDEIEWIEAADYYSVIHTADKRYMLRESLRNLERMLIGKFFARSHRKALVNLKVVRELVSDMSGNYKLTLRSGKSIPLSRQRKESVERLLVRLR